MRTPLSLKEIQWTAPDHPLIILRHVTDVGTCTFIALREPSMRTDIAKLTVYGIGSNSQEEVKLTEDEGRNTVVGKHVYEVLEPTEAEIASAKKVLERYEVSL